ncbi:MAG: PAS domain S-box protein [Deltaproteobacteria bacterium]|nr:PAS domain S-box protein [Deltaproteobacteria bacterium]
MAEKPTYEELEKRVHELEGAEFERKQAEKKLRKEMNFSQTLLQASAAFYVAISAEGKTIMINGTMLHAIGYKKEEVVGKDYMMTLVPERNREELSRIFNKLVKINRPTLNENYILTKDGKELLVEWHGRPIFNEKGEFDYFFGVGIDITLRRQAEEKLQEAATKWQSTFEAMSDSVSILDLNGHILECNSATLKMFDVSDQEIKKKHCWQLVHGLSEPIENCPVVRMKKSKKPESMTFQEKGRWLEVSVDPILDNTGQLKGSVHVVSDITERKQTEEALQTSHERFLTVLDSIDATIYVADMETYEILFMNKNMIESFGRDLTGEICWDVFRGESEPCRQCTNDRLIDENGKSTGVCVWQDRNPITEKWYINYDRAIEWTDGRLVRLQIATDITSLKRVEEELRQAHKMESIGTLAGGIAHDFNNILYIITGNAELALEDIPEWNPVHANLKEIKAAGLRAAGIVKQLLNFSRKTDEELKNIGAITVIKDALNFLQATIPATIKIRKHLPDTDITIFADPIQVNQVLMNICTNASQAMEKTGGILEIYVEKKSLTDESADKYPDLTTGEYIKITVSDTGSGIDPEIINRIFDPYFTTKEFGKGSGMGLAVVHGIVKNHGGAITVDSEPEKGATFTILFPVVVEKPVAVVKAPDEIPLGTETILFVDDEKSIVNIIGQMFERLGYKVETKQNPVEALKLFQSKPDEFDLVITDMTMPQMTGVKLSEKLKDVRPEIPVIICTGHSSLIDEEKAKKLGISAYVMKPIVMSDIAKTIRKVLDEAKETTQG